MTTGRIVKNVGSGLFAQVWSLLLGLVVLPVLVRGLGATRYGLLALSLAIIGFASVADLGVGRAASKYLAEDFEKNEYFRTQQYISNAFTISLCMGILGTFLLAWATPYLVREVFRIEDVMQRDAELALWITAAGLLPVLLRILFDGVLAGHHRIALLSLGNMLSNSLKAGLSVAVILLGYSLAAVVLANVVVSYLYAAGLWLYTRHYFADKVEIRFGLDSTIARQLLSLGVGSTLSYVLGYIVFLYVDRFLIAAFLTLPLLGYYSAAFDITSKQCYIPNSVAQAMFPEFSGKAATNPQELERRYLQASKAVAVGVTGLAMLLIVFGRELLTYWLNLEFGKNASGVMILLSVSVLFSCYTSIPYTAIIAGAARPNVCVRLFTVAILLHVGISLALIRSFGILGVAFAFALAYLYVFASALLWVRRNLIRTRVTLVLRHCFAGAWMTSMALGFVLWFLVKPSLHNLFGVFVAFLGGYTVYLALCALTAYTPQERISVLQIGRRLLRGAA